jgi:chaperonin GroES
MSEKSPITPLGDRVIVRPLTDAELGTVSASGIIIPDTAKKEKPEQGIVIAAGPGKWNEDGDVRIAMDVKEGDRVVFSKYGFDELKFDGNEYYIVAETSILGILNKQK